jgi:hypothetical protein
LNYPSEKGEWNMAKSSRGLVLACAAAGIVGGCLSSVLFHSLIAHAEPSTSTASVIRVKRLDIVDDTGTVRAWIGMESGSAIHRAGQESPAITIGRTDQQHVVLADDGIMLLGPQGSGHEIRAQLGTTANPRWGLAIYDANGAAKYSWVAP